MFNFTAKYSSSSGLSLSLLLGLGVSVLFLSCSLASSVGPPLSVSHDSK